MSACRLPAAAKCGDDGSGRASPVDGRVGEGGPHSARPPPLLSLGIPRCRLPLTPSAPFLPPCRPFSRAAPPPAPLLPPPRPATLLPRRSSLSSTAGLRGAARGGRVVASPPGTYPGERLGALLPPTPLHAGLGSAIGIPELGDHFVDRTSFRAAIHGIKANTRDLAVAQVSKIRRMADDWGWPIRRLDASATVRARLAGAGPAAEEASWERDVRGPGLAAIQSFLRDGHKRMLRCYAVVG